MKVTVVRDAHQMALSTSRPGGAELRAQRAPVTVRGRLYTALGGVVCFLLGVLVSHTVTSVCAGRSEGYGSPHGPLLGLSQAPPASPPGGPPSLRDSLLMAAILRATHQDVMAEIQREGFIIVDADPRGEAENQGLLDFLDFVEPNGFEVMQPAFEEEDGLVIPMIKDSSDGELSEDRTTLDEDVVAVDGDFSDITGVLKNLISSAFKSSNGDQSPPDGTNVVADVRESLTTTPVMKETSSSEDMSASHSEFYDMIEKFTGINDLSARIADAKSNVGQIIQESGVEDDLKTVEKYFDVPEFVKDEISISDKDS